LPFKRGGDRKLVAVFQACMLGVMLLLKELFQGKIGKQEKYL